MTLSHRPYLVLAVIWFSGCGTADDSGGIVDSATRAVCGEGGTGFVLRSTGGQLGLELFSELGFRFTVISPSCRFAVSDTSQDYQGAAVEGSLTDEQAEELSALLRLDAWDDFEPQYGVSGCDAGWVRYAIGDRVFDVVPFCPISPIPEKPDAFRESTTRIEEAVSRLRSLGEPASGPVRYVLCRTTSTHRRYDGAPEWPLDVSVDVASMTTLSEGPPFFEIPVIHVAEGEDASQLRALRSEFLKGDTSPLGAGIPIKEPDGARFDLYVRDVIEFETADGKAFVPWVDLDQPVAPIQP